MVGVTYNKKFHIKQNSTLPMIKYPIGEKLMEMYDITEDMLKSVGVTFSMFDIGTGVFHVANAPAKLIVLEDRSLYPDEEKYTLAYKFEENETAKTGFYGGEFVIDFLGYNNCGKIKFPMNNHINIVISNTITKTTVI